MERRFGQNQVCSVGSVTTLQIKGAIKDLDRQLGNDYAKANLMTQIIDDKDSSMLDLYKRAASEPKLKAYIKEQSEIFHLMPTILNQPKAKSLHPCAMIIFPKIMSANQWTPMRMQNGLLVSEWNGEEMDLAGFLKEDILGVKQLDKFEDILTLIKKSGVEPPDIYNLPHSPEVYRYFGNGWNGDVFQLGSAGQTEYTRSLKPQNIEDLIVANALYRPGPMENHYHEIYVKCKNEGRKPVYLWGTENITKNTFGLIVYQEQIISICQEVGGLSLAEADDVRKAMGKKKMSVLVEWKTRIEKGFLEKGCPAKEFDAIWDTMLEFAKYSFNRSHSAAYALTGYIGQYLKVHFPLEYWTVALDYANEVKTLTFLSEISQTKAVSVVPPDINDSDIEMISNMDDKNIYWGIGSIKGIGEDTASQIIDERKKDGKYVDITDFIKRHSFKGSRVKKQTYEALISSGAFDTLHKVKEKRERLNKISFFRDVKKVKISKPDRDPYTIGELQQNWWWLLKQKELTGLAFFDYKTLLKESGIERDIFSRLDLNTQQKRGIFKSFGGYVVDFKVSRSKKGMFARITIEHNYSLYKIIIWSEEYKRLKDQLKGCEKSLILFTARLQYEAKWTKGNQFTFTEDSVLKVLK